MGIFLFWCWGGVVDLFVSVEDSLFKIFWGMEVCYSRVFEYLYGTLIYEEMMKASFLYAIMLAVGLIVGFAGGFSIVPPKTSTVYETVTNTLTSTFEKTFEKTIEKTVTEKSTYTYLSTVSVPTTIMKTITQVMFITHTVEVPAKPKPRDVVVVSNITLQYPANYFYKGSLPRIEVRGEVKNIGSACVSFVKVIATFYDNKGKVIGSEFSYSDPYTLYPGESAPFQITWDDLLALAWNKTKLDITYSPCIS